MASITPLPNEPLPERDPRVAWSAAPGGGTRRTGIRSLYAAPDTPGGDRTGPVGHEAGTAFGMLREGQRTGRLLHLEQIPARPGVPAAWPDWVPDEVTAAFGRRGVAVPWSHQVTAADHARAGRNVIISTGTASGKSLGYLLPALTGIGEGGTALYIAPTKALAADQLAAIRGLGLPGVRAATLDGDTSAGERAWARSHANYLLTNPDMLHYMLLPHHRRWSGFFSRLRYVIIDECHGYRGVFGSHVGHVLRRLRRVAAHHARDARPVFLLASATAAQPGETARRLTGLEAEEVTADGSPHGPVSFAMWEPPLTEARGEAGAPVRRTATAEAAELLAGLVREDVATLAFIRSRRGAEAVALHAKRLLTEQGAADHASRVAAYRSGYLAEDRRGVEAALRGGRLTGLATTTALEVGINITGLDAVLIAGWPGTKASLWQQAGRAGRRGTSGPDRPGRPTRYLSGPSSGDPAFTGRGDRARSGEPLRPGAAPVRGGGRTAAHRRGPRAVRPGGRRRGRRSMPPFPAAPAPVRLVLDPPRARGPDDQPARHGRGARQDRGGKHRPARRHGGRAIRPRPRARRRHLPAPGRYLPLDLADGAALVGLGDPGYVTSARQVTDIEVIGQRRQMEWGEARVCFGDVEVTRQVTSYTRRRADSGRSLGETPLDLPPRTLCTRAMWWTISAAQAGRLSAAGVDLPGAAHAAEHASIGLLPLFATCDRWDIGGVSTDLHPATGRLTVFVHDGHEGGAGFAERGYDAAAAWLTATRQAIASCECEAGCPSCIQSPKCGNGNNPLSKTGALALLHTLLNSGEPGAGLNGAGTSGKRGAAPAGGESGGRRTVRPWGGGAEPASSKA